MRVVRVAFAAALVFLAAAAGYAVGTDRAPGAGSADVGFLQDMILHHEQAVRIASTAVTEAPDSVVRQFAREVLIFQQYEIGLMEAYLQRWGHPRAGEHQDHRHMPGMAGDEQLEAFERATGRDVDAGFLRLMIVHHEGGVQMSDEAVPRIGDDVVRDLAVRMAKNQRTEIVEYRRTAERLGISLD